jgi:ATP-dependent phosphoenolpyruvate carboxykinase
MSVLADSAASKTPMGPKGVRLPTARSVRYNPDAAELQELTSRMSQARRTSFDNYNVQTRVVSRSTASTYLVTDDPSVTTGQAISSGEGRRVAQLQAEYIAGCDMLVIDGYIGNEPDQQARARLYIEEANANMAGMQQQLYFAPDAPAHDWDPEVVMIYTPNLPMPGYPNDRLIAVDLEAGITRVMNSDYFGES